MRKWRGIRIADKTGIDYSVFDLFDVLLISRGINGKELHLHIVRIMGERTTVMHRYVHHDLIACSEFLLINADHLHCEVAFRHHQDIIPEHTHTGLDPVETLRLVHGLDLPPDEIHHPPFPVPLLFTGHQPHPFQDILGLGPELASGRDMEFDGDHGLEIREPRGQIHIEIAPQEGTLQRKPQISKMAFVPQWSRSHGEQVVQVVHLGFRERDRDGSYLIQ